MTSNNSADSLKSRGIIYRNYGQSNIDNWIAMILSIRENESVLDLGCGLGKQLIPASEAVKPLGYVVGIDNDPEMLSKIEKKDNIFLINGSMEDAKSLTRDYAPFDLVYSCFALAGIDSPESIVDAAYNLLKLGRRLFVCGSDEGNHQALISLFSQVAPLPEKFQRGRMKQLDLYMTQRFRKTSVHRFANPVYFPNIESVMDFFRAETAGMPEANLAPRFEEIVRKEFESAPYLVSVKKVIGICGYK